MSIQDIPLKCPFCLTELSKVVTEYGKPPFARVETYVCRRCLRSFTLEELQRLWEERRRKEG